MGWAVGDVLAVRRFTFFDPQMGQILRTERKWKKRMSVTWVNGLVAGIVVATAGGAIAGYNMMSDTPAPPAFAEVTQVLPATQQTATQQELCEDVEVTHKKPPRDKRRIAGTAAGALIGGLLGNQVGGGDGKKLATVIGAAAGGYAGNKVQERAQADDTYTTMETQCETVTKYVDEVVGYDVTYRIGNEEGQVRMDWDPGEQIPLINGELMLEELSFEDNASIAENS
jgi:uncharacterized protein YcfJ